MFEERNLGTIMAFLSNGVDRGADIVAPLPNGMENF